jgi:hypothetical protein
MVGSADFLVFRMPYCSALTSTCFAQHFVGGIAGHKSASNKGDAVSTGKAPLSKD